MAFILSDCDSMEYARYQNQPLKIFDKTFLRDIPKETFDNIRDMTPLRFAKRAEHFCFGISLSTSGSNCMGNWQHTTLR